MTRIFPSKFDWKRLLGLLLAGDLIFLILHLIYSYTPLLENIQFSLFVDRGFAEYYQYFKELWILILFLILGIKVRSLLFLSLSLLFLYFLIDDAFIVHERMGAFLADQLNFQPAFGLRTVDFGELAVLLFFGLQFLLLLGAAFLHADPYSKIVFRKLLPMLLILAFLGIWVDMLQITISESPAYDILGIMDDGGEMVVMSVITWFVFRVYSSEKASNNP